ncbi:hypothetical protein NKL07_16470 [Mesorhizobium sp. C280B]|uniref:hypothetical protein n=1 Tax=unclassified Mesorhizobium TaxID=325217 RepID=UPI0018DBA535|nr:hypothetical protein [Mesorhizobium sp. LSJC280B00]
MIEALARRSECVQESSSRTPIVFNAFIEHPGVLPCAHMRRTINSGLEVILGRFCAVELEKKLDRTRPHLRTDEQAFDLGLHKVTSAQHANDGEIEQSSMTRATVSIEEAWHKG